MTHPDYERIAELERELGMTDPEPPRRPIRRTPTVCLTKNCDGDTEEVTTWSGQPLMRIHTCA